LTVRVVDKKKYLFYVVDNKPIGFHRLSTVYVLRAGMNHIGKDLLAKVHSFSTGEMIHPKGFGPRQEAICPSKWVWEPKKVCKERFRAVFVFST
jgi:hypothetical protein